MISRKARFWTLFAVIAVVMLVVVTRAVIAIRGHFPEFGPDFNPETSASRDRLDGIARTGRGLLMAIDAYHTKYGRVPAGVDDLEALVAGIDDVLLPIDSDGRWLADPDANPPAVWQYAADGADSCFVFCRLGMDASLVGCFRPGSGCAWSYDPGDGREWVDLAFLR